MGEAAVPSRIVLIRRRPSRALPIAKQIAEALEAAHEQGNASPREIAPRAMRCDRSSPSTSSMTSAGIPLDSSMP